MKLQFPGLLLAESLLVACGWPKDGQAQRNARVGFLTPGDLPVERPTKFRLIINLKTAKALTRILHQDADFRVVLGEPGRARPSRPIDHSIGQTGMPEMAVQNGPETA